MRTIRDNNFTICGWAGNATQPPSNGLWGAACPAGCRYLIYQAEGICDNSATSSLWINYTPSDVTTESLTVGGVVFKRSVLVTDATDLSGTSTAFVKNIDVIVSWTDSSGTHDSKVSTQLSRL
jgi:hypothetical protein